MLVGEETGIHGGELPMWSRLGQGPRRRGGRWLAGLAWGATLLLLVVALLRMFFHDATPPFAWLNAFTLYVYLPAYVSLAIAVWRKRWWLAVASGSVIACHLGWVLPDFRPATPYAPPSAKMTSVSRSLRVYYANVRGGRNMQMDEVLADALSYDPDVIVVAEMQGHWWHRMIDTNPLKSHPYGTKLRARNTGDVGIFSRLPVTRMEQILIGGRAVLVVDIALGDESLRLVALHSPRPNINAGGEYDKFWQTLEPTLAAEPGPVVVVGDFNATQHSLVYEQLEADGYRSAHEDRGRGYATTWPNGVYWIPPIRIDQAFLSAEVECESIEEGVGIGSDHKPLILDLRVHGDGGAEVAR